MKLKYSLFYEFSILVLSFFNGVLKAFTNAFKMPYHNAQNYRRTLYIFWHDRFQMAETIIKPAVHPLCLVLDLSFRICCCEYCTAHWYYIYVTDCTVIVWLSVSDNSAIFLAVCAVICSIWVFIFTTITNPSAHRDSKEIKDLSAFNISLYRRNKLKELFISILS